MKIAVVVPAFQPGRPLLDLVASLSRGLLAAIVVVDDGSGPLYAEIFEEAARFPGVRLLRHAVNLGKGAALKTAFNHVLCELPGCAGVVTADADGQHDPADVLRVARRLEEHPDSLVLGAREFTGRVPWRSRLGNTVTRSIVRLLMGQNLADTQTGLRGIPRALLPHLLPIASSGYEFELDMLITAKHHACPVLEERIKTIYEERNRSSHFDPLLDSMRIYFVLFRFSVVSLLTAGLDNLVFLFVYRWTGYILLSQAVGRAAAVLFNYSAARKAVFLSGERHRTVLPKYLLLVAASGALSYGLIGFLHGSLGIGVVWAKPVAECILFIANFAVQRDFVFTRRRGTPRATDWTRYYASTPFTARWTRRYTASVLVSALRRFAGRAAAIVEIGGANSCFLDRIVAEIAPRAYHIVDTNDYGLSLLRERLPDGIPVVLHRQDVLDLSLAVEADVVFSVGLIEHFDTPGTRKAILGHLELVKPGGCAILSYPTPTALYRAARYLTELAGSWKFPDERPLERKEVLAALSGRGSVVFEKTLWPLVFTQHLMVIRKT